MAASELRSGEQVLDVVVERLAEGAKWVAAGSLRDGGAPVSVPTLNSHLLDALGCDSRAGAIAYWDWEQIQALIRECWASIGAVVGPRPELWSNEANRTLDEVVAVLDKALCSVVVPAEPFERRPWSMPTVLRTCRIPFVPIASVAHIWLAEVDSLGSVLGRLAIDASSDPWDVLRSADPVARDLAAQPEVRDVADAIRRSMLDGPWVQYSPAAGLMTVADVFDGVPTVAELEAWVAASSGSEAVPDELVG